MTRLPRYHAAARRSFSSELVSAAQDFANSFRQWHLWSVLAVNDIMGRYRGSLLGPFWITLSNAAFILGVGLVYGELMHVSTEKYVPWIATGVTLWNLIVSTIQEGGDAFVQGALIIRQSSLPLPVFVWRVVLRSLINFAHQVVVIFVVALWFHYLTKINLPMAMLGLLLVLLNISWISFVAAIVAARFRDVQQVIATVLQLVFFVSPVIWIPAETSGGRGLLLRTNPVFHMLDVTRNPLLGLPAHRQSVEFLLIMGLSGWVVAFFFYTAVRRRIVHYL